MSSAHDRTSSDRETVVAGLLRELAEMQRRLEEALAERDEALAREKAVGEVLRAINSSHGDLAQLTQR
jgi:vacuolar-type H+-ATPase subunit I/STV1